LERKLLPDARIDLRAEPSPETMPDRRVASRLLELVATRGPVQVGRDRLLLRVWEEVEALTQVAVHHRLDGGIVPAVGEVVTPDERRVERADVLQGEIRERNQRSKIGRRAGRWR
jgi:hypothetical protein